MPLAACPECDMPMKVTNYEDVLIDVCPSCRGVWLDRGELQKIIAIVRAEESGDITEDFARGRPAASRPAPPPPEARPEPREEYSEKRRKKKKGWGLWDVLEEIID